MTGGLVGMIMGGALGEGIRQLAIRDSPAATLIAKGQAQGFTDADKIQLARVLEDTYTQMGI
jgi:hypothetical protein